MAHFPDASSQSTALVPYVPQQSPAVQMRQMKERLLDIFMEQSFKAQIADHKYLHSLSDGKIFVLLGTSSAGKSSVINALKAIDPSWVEMGPDLAGFLHMADMIKETFPSDYEKMSQGLNHTEIAHAIVDVFYKTKEGKDSDLGFLHWKSGSYSKSEILDLIHKVAKSPAFAPLDQSMYAKETAEKVNQKMIYFICSNSKQGRPVFVDGMAPDMIEAFLKQTDGYPVKRGLAYLPLHHLADRVTKRNETAKITGDDAEVRSYEQITHQFLDHYKRAESGEPVIGHMSLAQVERAFSKMKAKDKKEEEALGALKIKVIEEYRLSGHDKIPLASRLPYNVLVKTKHPPQGSVQRILKSYL